MGDSAPHPAPSAGPRVGSTSWHIKFYEDILKRCPNYVEVLMVLGGLYTQKKLYEKGLKVDERLAVLRKDDPIVLYNLACSYSLLKQPDKAFDALNKAFELGYHDVNHMKKDSDLGPIRSDPRYAKVVARMQGR